MADADDDDDNHFKGALHIVRWSAPHKEVRAHFVGRIISNFGRA